MTDHGAPGLAKSNANWLAVLRLYLASMLALSLLWEIGHLPLYALWRTARIDQLAFAVAHCTAGDLLIGTAALVLALSIAGARGWPDEARNYWRVGLLTILFGAGYTIVSEWVNVEIRKSWAYSPAMPIVPGLGTGLSPLAQWLLVPAASLYIARRGVRRPRR